jgi:hypothetical protein
MEQNPLEYKEVQSATNHKDEGEKLNTERKTFHFEEMDGLTPKKVLEVLKKYDFIDFDIYENVGIELGDRLWEDNCGSFP